jgi:hypothetical protein
MIFRVGLATKLIFLHLLSGGRETAEHALLPFTHYFLIIYSFGLMGQSLRLGVTLRFFF